MRPITADTMAAQTTTNDLRARFFIIERANDRLRHENRSYPCTAL